MAGIFGWSFGNSWQRGLEHRWCAGDGCRRDLDWFQPEFLAKYPQPMCGSCAAAKRTAELEVAAEANTRWAEAHVAPLPGEPPLVVSQILRGEVPWVTTLPPNVVPIRPVLEEVGE